MKLLAAATALALSASAAQAQAPPPPRLIVMLSVDQLSADLFKAYRPHFTGGLGRLAREGALFENGYQAHASTETCPGHATLLTGAHPARSGIVANNWIDFTAARADKNVYCAEDETASGSSADAYRVSPAHLRSLTLGDRLKRVDPAARVVAVAGKDRSAVMMAGHAADQLWYWKSGAFASLPGLAPAPVGAAVNASIADALSRPRAALEMPALCQPKMRAIPLGSGGRTVGTHRFDRAANDKDAFRASPELDGATLAMAAALVQQLGLGKREGKTDLLAVGLSATDYVGHGYGTNGVEMCLQLLSLDSDLGAFLSLLDRLGIDYAVALSADHGGLDLPERQRLEGRPEAQRVDPAALPQAVGAEVARRMGLPQPAFAGDWYLVPSVPGSRRAEALSLATALLRAHPQVEAAFTRQEVAAAPMPGRAPESWTLLQRFRASYDPARSGDLFVANKPYVTPIASPSGAVATHGSVWDYDRKVPILFWRKGMQPKSETTSAMTVDIAPTLASLIGLQIPAGEIDGRCLDIVAGDGSNCR